MTSLVVAAIALYLTSAEERDTIVYRLARQAINDVPRKMQNLVVDFLVSRQDSQLASEKAQSLREDCKSEDARITGLDRKCLSNNEENGILL